MGIYDERTPQNRTIYKERERFGIRVDLNKLGETSRAEVIDEIEQVLARLRQE